MRNMILAITALVLVALTCDAGANFDRSIADDLETLAQLAPAWDTVEGAEGMRIVMERLRSAPSEHVVPEVVNVLANHPGYTSGQSRRSAFALLRDHKAALFEDGFAQLLEGLTDPDGVQVALVALRLTPETKREDLVS